MFKNKKIKKISKNGIISVSLVLALLITGIFAFLQATDNKTNVITLGDVGIKLVEEGWEEVTETGNTNYGLYVRTDGSSVDTTPGDEIDKEPYVVNTGVNNVWTYLIIKVPTLTETEFSNTATYLSSYGAKYSIKTTAVGVQDGLLRDKDGNNISNSADIWNSYFGTSTSLFDEEPVVGTRKEFIEFKGLDDTNWTKLMTFEGTKHNFIVYGYNTVLKGSKALEKELATLNAIEEASRTQEQTDRITEINAMLTANEYEETTKAFTSIKLNSLFGSGYGSDMSAHSLGGCLYYIDTSADAGCDAAGHPYRYTFYDEDGNELAEDEIFTGNHKIASYKVQIPQYYEDELNAGNITLAEYNAISKTPVKDKYYVVAAEDNDTKTAYSLIYGNSDTSKATTVMDRASWSLANDAASVATFPLNVYVKNFLTENNIIDKYYTVSGDTWTLNSDAVDSNALLGMGKYNTKFIYEFYGTTNSDYFGTDSIWGLLELFNNDNTAIRNKTGCYDWYIPSKDEITAIRDTYASTTDKFSVSDVWTSSEITSEQVWWATGSSFGKTRLQRYTTYSDTLTDNKSYTDSWYKEGLGTIFVRSF